MALRQRVLLIGTWLVLAVSAARLPTASGYFVNVDAHGNECFFDRVSSGMKLSLTFEVVEGGFLDIDVKVVVPYALVDCFARRSSRMSRWLLCSN